VRPRDRRNIITRSTAKKYRMPSRSC
jgi:hypothetical protein